MQRNRLNAIAVPDRPHTAHLSRYFAGAVGQRFEAANVAGVTHIDLYDEIGTFGVTAKDFRASLKDAPGAVVLRVNSPGGDVFDGLAIYNDLLAHKGTVRVEISGVAASIATIIAMAGDEIAMAPRSFMMIHNSHALSIGDARTHTEVADVLREIDASMADTYAMRSGQDARTVKRWMDAETWFVAKEAKDAGLITEISEPQSAAQARFDLSIYANAPAELCTGFMPSAINPNSISNPRDYERFLREAGMSRSRAKALSAGYRSLEQREADNGDLELAAHIAAQAIKLNELKERYFE